MSTESVMPSNHLIVCCPLLLLPSIFAGIRVFQMSRLFASGSQSNWSFSFSIGPSKEYSGLISFRIDWFDLLAVQGTLKSLLQYHCSKASTLQHSAFIMVQTVTYVGEGNGNPLQYSCLENLRDRGAWWAAIYGVAQS